MSGGSIRDLSIPDHTLLQRIGGGSYGEVWLARNVVGTLRAVKVVRRASFKTERPYEREFSGMLKFEPVSRSHEGLMDILQIGRNDAKGCFYYVMELADNTLTAAQAASLDPAPQSLESERDEASSSPSGNIPYRARTLAQELSLHRVLPLADCLRYFNSLTGGLAAMHRAGLIHRDIKPSNIIVVGGVAKLADIGLVAGMEDTRSFVGTDGFIPPEGPGTVQADIYSLGKVLYEAVTGQDRKEYPSLPLGLDAKNPPQELLELNAIISRACAPNIRDRYANVMEMHADLAVLQSGHSVRKLHAFEGRLRAAKRAGILACVIAVVALGAFATAWWAQHVERVARTKTEAALIRVAKAERESREKLYDSLLSNVLAEKRSEIIGKRFRALDNIRRAAEIHPNADALRDAAVSALTSPDLSEIKRLPLPVWATAQGFSSDLLTRVVVHTNGVLHVLRTSDDVQVCTIPGDPGPITGIAPLGEGGRWVIIGRENDVIERWDLKLRCRDRVFTGVRALCASPDGERCAGLTSAGFVFVQNWAETRQHILTIGDEPHSFVQFAETNRLVVASFPKSRVRIVDGTSGRTEHSFHTVDNKPPAGLQVSPKTGVLGLTFDTGAVEFYPSERPVIPRTSLIPHDRHVGRLGFHPDGDWCLTVSWEGTTRLLGATEGQALSLLRTGSGFQVFEPEGRRVGIYESPGSDLVLYECAGREVCRVLGESNPADRSQAGPWNGAFSEDGGLLVSATFDGIRIYETQFGRELAHCGHELWYSVAFYRGTHLISAGPKGLALWPLLWRDPLHLIIGKPRFLERGHQWHLMTSRDGLRVGSAALTGRFVVLSPGDVRTEMYHNTDARGIAMSADGRRVASAVVSPPEMPFWDTQTGRRQGSIPIRSLGTSAFSPEGDKLVINEAAAVVLMDVESGREMWRTPLARGGGAIQWSPDGAMVVAVREGSVPVLMDASNGSVLVRLEHSEARQFNNVVFSPDSERLACFLSCHRIHLWDLRALRKELAMRHLDWKRPPLTAARKWGKAPQVDVGLFGNHE